MLALFIFVTHIYPDSIPQCNINLPGRETLTTPQIGTLIIQVRQGRDRDFHWPFVKTNSFSLSCLLPALKTWQEFHMASIYT